MPRTVGKHSSLSKGLPAGIEPAPLEYRCNAPSTDSWRSTCMFCSSCIFFYYSWLEFDMCIISAQIKTCLSFRNNNQQNVVSDNSFFKLIQPHSTPLSVGSVPHSTHAYIPRYTSQGQVRLLHLLYVLSCAKCFLPKTVSYVT